MSTLLHVGEGVGHEHVVARLGGDALDEAALGRVQAESLGPAGPGGPDLARTAEGPGALEEDLVELQADDVERRRLGGPAAITQKRTRSPPWP